MGSTPDHSKIRIVAFKMIIDSIDETLPSRALMLARNHPDFLLVEQIVCEDLVMNVSMTRFRMVNECIQLKDGKVIDGFVLVETQVPFNGKLFKELLNDI